MAPAIENLKPNACNAVRLEAASREVHDVVREGAVGDGGRAASGDDVESLGLNLDEEATVLECFLEPWLHQLAEVVLLNLKGAFSRCARRGGAFAAALEWACAWNVRACGTVEGPCVRFALTLCARVRAWSVVSGQFRDAVTFSHPNSTKRWERHSRDLNTWRLARVHLR